MSHYWQQKIIPSSGVFWRRAWWSSYRLPWLSARVGPLMSLSHDPSLTRLSGLRTDTCCDPLGRHAFRAQTASCEATKGALRQSLLSRGCHGYIPEEYINALYPYPLRIRAVHAYSKCIMRKRGEDISILSDKNCKIISDPYSRYERQD